MYFLVLLVLDDNDRATDICDAWEAAGVSGITILESTGLGRLRYKQGYRDDIPLMPSIRSLLQAREEHHRTLFSVVDGEVMVDALINATEKILGDLNLPNSGIMIALPVARAAGMNRQALNAGDLRKKPTAKG
jgi:nitrogen regulatory protein P-II 1